MAVKQEAVYIKAHSCCCYVRQQGVRYFMFLVVKRLIFFINSFMLSSGIPKLKLSVVPAWRSLRPPDCRIRQSRGCRLSLQRRYAVEQALAVRQLRNLAARHLHLYALLGVGKHKSGVISYHIQLLVYLQLVVVAA
mgnify:CR=1 FL=1